jgi:8-oxo-dGTP pyrophosphatase MutT (NUDIX family)
LDDQILFYQREDTQKRFDTTAGDYGLIGGRANQNDIPLTNKETVLKALQSANSGSIKQYLPETLQRELREETGLIFDEHYTFKPWRTLQSYQQVQGSAPNHALTEYYLDIFQLDLTLTGYLHLLQKIQADERLVWFSIADIVRGKTEDEKIPYIKALYNDFSGDRDALKTELMALENSFSSAYQFQPEKYGITLPFDDKNPIFSGKLGKEKALNVSLTTRQLQILLGLAAHLREFKFSRIDKEVTFHPFGWIKVKQGSTLQSELITLTNLINQTDLVMENYHDLYFRLSVKPSVVCFDAKLFAFIVEQNNLNSTQSHIPVLIQRSSFNTALGQVKEEKEEFKSTIESVHNFQKLATQQYDSNNEKAIKIEDTYKKGLHKKPDFLKLGLRNLIRREDGQIKFTIAYQIE